MNVTTAKLDDIALLVGIRLAYLADDFGALRAGEADKISRELSCYFAAHLNRDIFCYLTREVSGVVVCAFLLLVEKPASRYCAPAALSSSFISVALKSVAYISAVMPSLFVAFTSAPAASRSRATSVHFCAVACISAVLP